MNYIKQITDYLDSSGGIITSKYCRENNIPTVYLTRLSKQGKLNKISKGIYARDDADFDELYFFQYRFRSVIYSYETSLYLLGETDEIIEKFDVTVNSNYKFNNFDPKVRVHYVKKEYLNIGVMSFKTIYGNTLKAYSFERTVCDFIMHKEDIDSETYISCLKAYNRYRDKDINKLYEIAVKFNILDKVRDVMELIYE